MPLYVLIDFLTIVIVVFFVSGIATLFTIRPQHHDSPLHDSDEDDADQLSRADALEKLAEEISQDEDLLAPAPPVHVPHIDLPGAMLGGGATKEACSKVTGTISLKLTENPDEKRKYNRRLRDRRLSDDPVKQEQRMVQRRVWLRREEDRRGKRLLNVSDAADTLGVAVEQIYNWLDKSDIPFYQVTEGRKKAIRFEINELLQWYSAFISSDQES